MDETLDHAVHRHEPSRCAVSALQCVLLLENLLHLIQSLWSVQSFERKDFRSVGLYRQQSAGTGGVPINQDRARSTCTFPAGNFESRQAQMIAQEIAQQETVDDGRI